MDKVAVTYYGLNVKKVVLSDFSLILKGSSNAVSVENDDFSLKIILADMVDADDLAILLRKDKNKIELLSHLEFNKKTYKGKRKFIWKDKCLMMSQGGIRIVFGSDAISKMMQISSIIKENYSKP
ncbi:MAG: hypothetical protein KKF44_00335 [Nanoarchaeota archaeon]|nr:hypothetical protein [Nanoarchaeota archaeon]